MGCQILESPVAAVSLMISYSLGAVESIRHPREQFVDNFKVPRGFWGCRIQASPVAAVSLMISESLGLVWAVESKRHPWMQFR
jgi:hypothetical protein